MALTSTTARNDYLGDGSTATYAFGFEITAKTELSVKKRLISTGVESTLVLNTDFTVADSFVNNAAGGSLVLTAGVLSALYALSIRRVVPLTQATDLRNQGSYLAESVESTFDKLTKIDQQQQDTLARSIQLPESEAGSAAAVTLPAAALRASKFLAFDASGNPMASSASAGTATSAWGATLVDDADATAGRVTMGLAPTDTAQWGAAQVITTGGVTARSLSARFADIVNVKDFGATGDGTTDDTVAIQAAINSGAGLVQFSRGKYRLTATLSVAAACVLEGVGANGPGAPTTATQVFLVHDFSGTCIDFIGSAVSDTVGSGSGVRNLTILQNNGAGTGASGVCIRNHSVTDTQRANWFRIENVHVEEVTGKNGWTYCVSLDGTANANLLRDVFIRGCRFVAGPLATAAMRVAGVANLLMSDCESNLANANILLTGDATHLTATALISNCTFATITHDYAQLCTIIGGSCSTLTYSVNSNDNIATGITVGAAAPSIAGTRNTVVGKVAATGKYSVYTNNNTRFDMGLNTAEFTGPVLSETAIGAGTIPATVGAVRLANAVNIAARNAANTDNVTMMQVDGINRVQIAPGGADILWGRTEIALGGGAAPTVGTIGGSGPAAAAQAGWMKVINNAGQSCYIPVWR